MIFPFRDNVPLRRRPVVTYLLIAVNVAVFCAMLCMSPLEREWFEYRHGFVPARISQISSGRPLNVQLEISGRDPRLGFPIVFRQDRQLDASPVEIFASLATTMFLHAGWLHLISNMWFLWLFGDNVEDRLGRLPFACFYLAGGLLATMFHWWNNPASDLPLVGASGAIAAVLGAYAVTWPAARLRSLVFIFIFFTIVELPALLVLGLWFATQLFEANNGLELGTSGGTAWWVHIGGFLAGAPLMPLIEEKSAEAAVESDQVIHIGELA